MPLSWAKPRRCPSVDDDYELRRVERRSSQPSLQTMILLIYTTAGKSNSFWLVAPRLYQKRDDVPTNPGHDFITLLGYFIALESQENDSNPHPVHAITFVCKTTNFMSPWQEEP
jgi:hypothetical protein